jgi:hypothetical protein
MEADHALDSEGPDAPPPLHRPSRLAAAMLAGLGLPASPAVAKDAGAKVEGAKAAKSKHASANGRKNR